MLVMSSVKTPGPRALAFKQWMGRLNTNTKQVAEKSGVSYTTLASFVQGSTRSLKGETEEKIARAYGITAELLFASGDEPTSATVPLVGYVGAGAVAHYYATGDGGLDDVPAPQNATANTVAAEIRGESLMSVVSPYRLQTFGLADAHPDQMILQVQTTEGVPLQLSMSRQDAIELERALKSYLDRPPGQAQKPHH